MATTFFPARGCVYIPPSSGGQAGVGFYRLNPPLTGGSKETPILIMGAELTETDITQQIVTLDNTKLIYTFGSDFGQVSVTCAALLGSAGKATGQNFAAILEYFATNRVNTLKRPISVSVPGNKAYKWYLKNMAIGQADPQFHIQYIMLSGPVVGSL